MHIIAKLFLGTALLAGAVTGALAQAQPGDPPIPTYNDPPGPLPNPLNITMHPGSVFPENRVFGDPSKPGIYGMITTWQPGKFSRPHFHNTDRFVYVVSGTWWVSASNDFDPKTTYPIPQGTFAVDLANKVHWDGNRLGGPPTVLYIVGEGPLTNISVGHDGKPLAVQPNHQQRPAAPAAAPAP
ncbi:MAG TPA: cupin domain-containing protein [Acidobacteriaceae bacterium]|nr:cupin domain-containing protein [Acidobacteriaceae bacterium]HWA69097.1 cupin domain-containing protein [Rhizomicrobium sp.]